MRKRNIEMVAAIKKGLVAAGCVISMALMCVGCSGNDNSDIDNGQNKQPQNIWDIDLSEKATTKEVTTEEPTTKVPETTTNSSNDINSQNEYINNYPYVYYNDVISLNLKYVYWDNGWLIVECAVCNGYYNSVSNIEVKELTIMNENGVIASACFDMPGAEIEARDAIMWRFKFGPDCVFKPDADLSTLSTYFEVDNSIGELEN